MSNTSVDMEYRRLGDSGVKLSALGLGGWTTFGKSIEDGKLARDIILKAFESGIVFFDIADVYARGESERAMGKVFKELPRHHLVISSKVLGRMSDNVNDVGLSRKHIMEAVEASLKRIGTDYLDLYYCHSTDDNTPVEETMCAMDDLVRQGKVLYWGISNWNGGQIRDVCGLADRKGRTRPRVSQPELSLVSRKRVAEDVGPACIDHGIGMTTYSPLGCGVLTGKYDDGLPEGSRLERIEPLRKSYLKDENIKRVKALKALADQLECTRAQLALAWTMAQPGVTSVITGATRPEQVEDNLGALKVKITEEVSKKLDELFPKE